MGLSPAKSRGFPLLFFAHRYLFRVSFKFLFDKRFNVPLGLWSKDDWASSLSELFGPAALPDV